MENKNYAGYLEQYGKTLIDNGYSIIPIPTGSKSPGFSGWEKTVATHTMLKDWLDSGHETSGVGILTKKTPAIDLDIMNKEVADLMEAWCIENIGQAAVRVGRAPRRILMFRTDTPFRKMKTGKFVDEWGDEHEIEILADGQQFLAYAIHKDTGRAYKWTSDFFEPAETHASELTLVTPEQCKDLMAYFVEVAKERGWERKSNGMSGEVRPIDAEDDPFADVESVVDISKDELRNRLMLVPASEDYDRWVQVGMALYHQFGGDETGLGLWHEWSELADNYDAEALDKHWRSFEIEGKKRSPVTARTILKLAMEAETTYGLSKTNELKDKFMIAKDLGEWMKIADTTSKTELEAIHRAQLVEIAHRRYREIVGERIPIAEVRRYLAYKMPNSKRTPKWCHNWVYDSEVDKLVHVELKVQLSEKGFNAAFTRNITKMPDGETPSPFNLALNTYQIPVVYGQSYVPDKDAIFKRNGLDVLNTYREYLIPKSPKELLPIDLKAIDIVKKHIAHILSEEKEQRLFTDWLAWIVQNPGKLLCWAMVLQGVQGDGKTFFGLLLRAVMGSSNVRMMNAGILEGQFTGWAVGQCVAVVEEPRLHGNNRYEVINRIKPFISNHVIEVHAKGRDPFDAENTTNYYMPTNFKDALPLSMNERRYCVLFSRWQNREELTKFVVNNPDYYVNLYNTLRDNAPALRKWLLTHEVSETFPAGGNAPMTPAFEYMVESSRNEVINDIEEIITEGEHYDVSEELLNVGKVRDILLTRGLEVPQPKTLAFALSNNGWTKIGRIRVGEDRHYFWTKRPEMFVHAGHADTVKIKSYLESRRTSMTLPIDDEL